MPRQERSTRTIIATSKIAYNEQNILPPKKFRRHNGHQYG